MFVVQWTPSNPATLRACQSELIEWWPHFRGEFELGSILGDNLNNLHFRPVNLPSPVNKLYVRGGLISGTLIRGKYGRSYFSTYPSLAFDYFGALSFPWVLSHPENSSREFNS